MNHNLNLGVSTPELTQLALKDLGTLNAMFDDNNLTVGFLKNVAHFNDQQFKDYFWDRTMNIENGLGKLSDQASYATLIAMFCGYIEEYQLPSDTRVRDLIIVNPEPFSLSRTQYCFNSVVTKIINVRTRF